MERLTWVILLLQEMQAKRYGCADKEQVIILYYNSHLSFGSSINVSLTILNTKSA